MTQSQLDQILKEKTEAKGAAENESEGESNQSEEDDEVMNQDDVSPKDYDYLLKLPLWSLSQEKVVALKKQQEMRKAEYDELEGTHIYQLWNQDLDNLLEALEKQEAREEADRLAHKNKGISGGSRRRQPTAPKRTTENQKSAINKKQEKSAQPPSLMERLAKTAMSSGAQHQLQQMQNSAAKTKLAISQSELKKVSNLCVKRSRPIQIDDSDFEDKSSLKRTSAQKKLGDYYQ